MGLDSQSISLYVHIPFCTQRCSYCDFYFVTTKSGYQEFVDALCLEITQVAQSYSNPSLSTIYFGGGTPSLLPSSALKYILDHIHHSFQTGQLREVTIEANPEDITDHFLHELLNIGITRVSLGVQSFDDHDLRFMNRCHDSDQAIEACRKIQSAGFNSWSLDLIFGVPDVSLKRWEDNLTKAIHTGVPHISTYSLTVEPSTPLYKQVQRGKVIISSDSHISDQFQLAMDILQKVGYQHYEISSFAQSGHESQHNSQYWSHDNYLGVGPSAHSFWWEDDEIVRWENVRNLRVYSDLIYHHEPPFSFRETLTKQDLVREKIMLSLRTSQGIDLNDLEQKYGYRLLDHKQQQLQLMESNGLITLTKSSVRLTQKGKHICDQITQRLWND